MTGEVLCARYESESEMTQNGDNQMEFHDLMMLSINIVVHVRPCIVQRIKDEDGNSASRNERRCSDILIICAELLDTSDPIVDEAHC